jgi:hypothetical protein
LREHENTIERHAIAGIAGERHDGDRIAGGDAVLLAAGFDDREQPSSLVFHAPSVPSTRRGEHLQSGVRRCDAARHGFHRRLPPRQYPELEARENRNRFNGGTSGGEVSPNTSKVSFVHIHCATSFIAQQRVPMAKAAFIAKLRMQPKTSGRLAILSGRPLQSLTPVVNHPFPKRVSDRRPTHLPLSLSLHLDLENGPDWPSGFPQNQRFGRAGLLFSFDCYERSTHNRLRQK